MNDTETLNNFVYTSRQHLRKICEEADLLTVFLFEHESVLLKATSLDVGAYGYGYPKLELWCLRDELKYLMTLAPGNWEKVMWPHGTAEYKNQTKSGIKICINTDLPPSCHLEYEEVHVPARTEKRAKVICREATS